MSYKHVLMSCIVCVHVCHDDNDVNHNHNDNCKNYDKVIYINSQNAKQAST